MNDNFDTRQAIPWRVGKRDLNGTGNVAILEGDKLIAFVVCKDWGYEATATRAEARELAILIVSQHNAILERTQP